jgi:hypothetical protein
MTEKNLAWETLKYLGFRFSSFPPDRECCHSSVFENWSVAVICTWVVSFAYGTRRVASKACAQVTTCEMSEATWDHQRKQTQAL